MTLVEVLTDGKSEGPGKLNYETEARQARLKGTLDDIEARFAAAEASGSLAAKLRETVLAVSTNGTLQAHIQQIVEDNRQQAKQQAAT